MQHRRARSERGRDVDDHRQVFVLDLDEAGRFFGRFARLGGNGGNAIADIEHFVVREHGQIVEHSAGTLARSDVGRGQHGVHARHALRRARIDAHDSCMRDGTRRERGPQHVRQMHVGRVLHLAANLIAAFDADFVSRENAVPAPRRGDRRRHAGVASAFRRFAATSCSVWSAFLRMIG